MKKIIAVLMILTLLSVVFIPVFAESFLPQIDEVYGAAMPSLRSVVLRKPEQSKIMDDGAKKVVFSNITEDDYDRWSEYLETTGCSLVDFKVESGLILATVSLNNNEMSIEYDNQTEIMTIVYYKGTYEEPARAELFSTVRFGHYEQDNDLENGPEPIEWIVLEVQDGKCLLFSKLGLESRPYNKNRQKTTWAKCSLRKWLNKEFLNSAFTKEEQAAILVTKVDNSDEQGRRRYRGYDKKTNSTIETYTDGGVDTEDRLYLFSYGEIYDVYYHPFLRKDDTIKCEEIKSPFSPTEYVLAAGGNEYETECWWLRSPGEEQTEAMYIQEVKDKNTFSFDDSEVQNALFCVRPLLWFDLNMIND